MNEKKAKKLRRFVDEYCARVGRRENKVEELPVGRPKDVWIESPIEHRLVKATIQGSQIILTDGPRFIYRRLKKLLKLNPSLTMNDLEGVLR